MRDFSLLGLHAVAYQLGSYHAVPAVERLV